VIRCARRARCGRTTAGPTSSPCDVPVFAGHVETLRTLREKQRFAVDLSCAVYLDPDASTPALSLPADMVRSIAALGASLDIDLYVR